MGLTMWKRIIPHFDNMAFGVLVWMCTLPLVVLLVLPFFGVKISLLVSAGLLIVILAVCWSMCSWKIFKS